MIRRAVVLTSLLLAWTPATARAATELNVLPHGQHEPGVAWATRAGMLPANAQALMYDRLTPLGRNITDAVLQPSADGSGYFKSARLLAADDPSLITDETVSASGCSARIRRDAYGVPHVYSDTDDGVLFGAGYVHRRGPQPAARPDARQRDGRRDRHPRRLGDHARPRALHLQADRRGARGGRAPADAALRRAGPEGRQVLRDIDTYLVGINLWYCRNRPARGRSTARDIYATNAIKAQYLGEGGGDEIPNALLLDAARDRFGARRGNRGLRGPARPQRPRDADDRRSCRAPWETSVPVGARARPRPARAGDVPRASAPSCRARPRRRPRCPRRRPRTCCWSPATAPPRARRCSPAARRSATTTRA